MLPAIKPVKIVPRKTWASKGSFFLKTIISFSSIYNPGIRNKTKAVSLVRRAKPKVTPANKNKLYLFWFIAFYSRVGLIETTLGFFSFLFFYLYEKAINQKRYSLFLLAGVTLGLALLTKLTALVLFLIPGLYILLKLIMVFRKKEPLDAHVFLGTILTGLIAGSIVLPILSFYYFSESVFFKEQVKYILSYGPKAVSLGEIVLGSEKFVRMYSWGTLLFLPFGLVSVAKNKKFLLFNLSFLSLLFVLLRNPLSVETLRYYVFFTPFL